MNGDKDEHCNVCGTTCVIDEINGHLVCVGCWDALMEQLESASIEEDWTTPLTPEMEINDE
jgi:hypothetical protein